MVQYSVLCSLLILLQTAPSSRANIGTCEVLVRMLPVHVIYKVTSTRYMYIGYMTAFYIDWLFGWMCVGVCWCVCVRVRVRVRVRVSDPRFIQCAMGSC